MRLRRPAAWATGGFLSFRFWGVPLLGGGWGLGWEQFIHLRRADSRVSAALQVRMVLRTWFAMDSRRVCITQ